MFVHMCMFVCVSAVCALPYQVLPMLSSCRAFQDLAQLLSLLDKELVSNVFPPKKTPPTTTSTREEQ